MDPCSTDGGPFDGGALDGGALDGGAQDAPGSDSGGEDAAALDSGDQDADVEACVAPSDTCRVLGARIAFPSAVGGGSIATGGRGGRVIHVTTLAADGPGSFRAALLETGPRTVVFDVSGRIELESRIELIAENGDLTIAGETAPEGGITISGKPLLLSGGYNRPTSPTDNVIIRHVRIRNGSYTGVPDVGDHNGIISGGTDRFVFDHMSFSFNDDQAISMDGNWGPLQDGTIQRCVFSENATGIITGLARTFPIQRLSTVHNLFVHQGHRTPNIGGDGQFDIVNNVVFNWGSRLVNANAHSPQVNYIGNHLTPGTESGSANKVQSPSTPRIYTAFNHHPTLYPAPQLDDRGLWTNFSGGAPLAASYFTTEQFPLLANTVLQTAIEARADVLADVGTNSFVSDAGVVGRYLDSYDTQRLEDVATETTRDPFNKSWTQPVLPNGTRPEGFYGSLPDIPRFFVAAHGIASNDDVLELYDFGDVQVRNDAGYTAFEMYLFYAAGDFTR